MRTVVRPARGATKAEAEATKARASASLQERNGRVHGGSGVEAVSRAASWGSADAEESRRASTAEPAAALQNASHTHVLRDMVAAGREVVAPQAQILEGNKLGAIFRRNLALAA